MSFVSTLLMGVLLQTGTVEGSVRLEKEGASGSVKNALVYIRGYDEPPPKQPAQLLQIGRSFIPVVLPVVRRQWVHFVNNEPDRVYHHVFSPSKDERFDTGWYLPGTQKRRQFSKEGRIDVFCDIHKNMIASLYVVPNRQFTVLEDAEGPQAPFRIEGVRPGKVRVVGWHRSSDKPVEQEIDVKPGQTTHVELVIRAATGIEALLGSHKRRNGGEYDHDEKLKEKDPW